jgi:MFS family permease
LKAKFAPYINLVKNNHNYRRLWLSQVVSNFGDWFGLLAIYALIQKYSNSELLLGLIIVVKMLSLAGFSPIAGYITDRFNRRKVMIWCDILRAVIVLGFLFVSSAGLLWLAYLLTALQMMHSAVFEPAKTSSIPNVTYSDELVNANILSAASWSIIFTSGMALGGFATALLGTDLVFIINSITYVVSALFIARAHIPQTMMNEAQMLATRNPLKGISEGFRFLFEHKHILRVVMVKGASSMCRGALVYMLILVAEDILLMGSIGLGMLYAARGIGTGIGPVLGRRLFKKEQTWLKAIGLAMIFCGLAYAIVGVSESILIMVVFVMFAHMASGSNWVMSTVLLQRRAPDTYRGRMFSTEWLLFTLTQSVSVIIASLLLEFEILTIREAIFAFSMLLVAIGVSWLIKVWPVENKYQDDQNEPKPVLIPSYHKV